MQVALMGDIHGNALALRAVLDKAVREGVEKLLITGDLVGYYFSPGMVLELLGPWNKHMVRGNHEEMLALACADASRIAAIESRYGSGLRLALEELSDLQIEELCRLPHPLSVEIDGLRILLCHGAPWDSGQYVYPDAPRELIERCAEPDVDIVVMGHTHYPMRHDVNNCILVNPGSVGQPRNHRPGADWALLDTRSGKIEMRHEKYDIQALVDDAKRRHPEMPHLAEVLTRT